MDLTPGEKAVLNQIRVLYATSGGRDQQVKALLMQWPPTHYEAYRKAYGTLRDKALLQDTDGQSFRLTDVGLKAIGVTPRPVVQVAEERRPAPAAPAQPMAPIKRPSALARLMAGWMRAKA